MLRCDNELSDYNNARAVDTNRLASDNESISVLYKSQLIGISPNLIQQLF